MAKKKAKKKGSHSLFVILVIVLLGCCFSTLFITIFYHGRTIHIDHHSFFVEKDSNPHWIDNSNNKKVGSKTVSLETTTKTTTTKGQQEETNNQQGNNNNNNMEKKYLLNCDAYGGPSKEIADEMVYWKDIPSDHIAPFLLHSKNKEVAQSTEPPERKYISFEPDGGGFNNIRMSMETIMAMAAITGRTLVLPPSQRMYLLRSRTFSFADFFPLHQFNYHSTSLGSKNTKRSSYHRPVLEIMTMEDFLKHTNGTLRNHENTNEIVYPPKFRTNWDGDTKAVSQGLNPFLQSISYQPDWDPEKCIAVFPDLEKENTNENDLYISSTFKQIKQEHFLKNKHDIYKEYINKPTPVNGTMIDRMKEFKAERDELCLYSKELQDERIIHFHGKKQLGARLLVHYYAWLFPQSIDIDLWMKRFVRDQLRYIDEIQCAAARIIHAVRERSRNNKKNGNDSKDGIYDSFHIRRGDFQYKRTRIEAKEIYDRAKQEIPDGTTVYIATDEKKEFYMNDMGNHWDVVFLSDYIEDLLPGIDKNYYGMIDQLVASKGRTFFGCWFSTFTGYINRIRGYHSTKNKDPGYELGLLPTTYYYALPQNKNAMQEYWPIKKLFYAREYPASWRDIDFGVVDKDDTSTTV